MVSKSGTKSSGKAGAGGKELRSTWASAPKQPPAASQPANQQRLRPNVGRCQTPTAFQMAPILRTRRTIECHGTRRRQEKGHLRGPARPPIDVGERCNFWIAHIRETQSLPSLSMACRARICHFVRIGSGIRGDPLHSPYVRPTSRFFQDSRQGNPAPPSRPLRPPNSAAMPYPSA